MPFIRGIDYVKHSEADMALINRKQMALIVYAGVPFALATLIAFVEISRTTSYVDGRGTKVVSYVEPWVAYESVWSYVIAFGLWLTCIFIYLGFAESDGRPNDTRRNTESGSAPASPAP